jgi:hypothetical protein
MSKVPVQQRLTSPHFPPEEFARRPPSKNYPAGRARILRRFIKERHSDYVVWYDPSPYDQPFGLRLLPKGVPPGVPGTEPTPTGQMGVTVDQATVNKIEIAKAAFSRGAFDFVLFEDSPQTEAGYRSIDQ